jgi:16S rRNA (adenine1518-N6/adenine1519-N6)-dimethyltransferase
MAVPELRKGLGQHLLADKNLAAFMARRAGIKPGDPVLEIGAGTGNLTVALLAAGAEVTAVEVDERLAAVLAERVRQAGWAERLRLAVGDAMALDLPGLVQGRGSVKLVSNLPYSIAQRFLVKAAACLPEMSYALVMVQREVAERIAAPLGSRLAGFSSVAVQIGFDARVVEVVPPAVFVPRPRVQSALLELERKDPAEALDPEIAGKVLSIASAAFGQRRKKLRKSLSLRCIGGAEHLLEKRPEQLRLSEWVELAKVVP